MSEVILKIRKHPRLNLRIPICYRRIEKEAQEYKGCLMDNISLGGIRAQVYEFLPLNLKLALEMPLSSGEKSVQGIGRVVWIKKIPFGEQYDIGLEFTHLVQGDEAQIARLISARSSEKIC